MKYVFAQHQTPQRWLYQSYESAPEVVTERLTPAEADAETQNVLDTVDNYLTRLSVKPMSERSPYLESVLYLLEQTETCLRNDNPTSELFPDLDERIQRVKNQRDLINRATALATKNPDLAATLDNPKTRYQDLKEAITFANQADVRKRFEKMALPQCLKDFGIDHRMLLQLTGGDPVASMSIMRSLQMEAHQDEGDFSSEQKKQIQRATAVGSTVGGGIFSPITGFVSNLVARFFARRKNRKEAAKFIQDSSETGESLVRKINNGERIRSFGIPQLRIHGQEFLDEHGDRYVDIHNYMTGNFAQIQRKITYLTRLDPAWTDKINTTAGRKPADTSVTEQLAKIEKLYQAGEHDRVTVTVNGKKRTVNPNAGACQQWLEKLLDRFPVFAFIVMGVENEINQTETDERLRRDFGVDLDDPKNADFISAAYATAYHETPKDMAIGANVMLGLDLIDKLGIVASDPTLEKKFRAGQTEKEMFQSVFENLLAWIRTNVYEGDQHPELLALLNNGGFDGFALTDLINEIDTNDNPPDPDNNYQHTNWYLYTENKKAPFIRFMQILRQYCPEASPVKVHAAGKTVWHYAAKGAKQLENKRTAEPLPDKVYQTNRQNAKEQERIFVKDQAKQAGGYEQLFINTINEKITNGSLKADLCRELINTSELARIFYRLGLSTDAYGDFYESLLPQIQTRYVYPLPAKYDDGDSAITNRALKEYLQDLITQAAATNNLTLWTEAPVSAERKTAFAPQNGMVSADQVQTIKQQFSLAKEAWYKGKNINCVAGIDRFVRSTGLRSPLETTGKRRDAWEVGGSGASDNIWKSKTPKSAFTLVDQAKEPKLYQQLTNHQVKPPRTNPENPDQTFSVIDWLRQDGYLGETITPATLWSLLQAGEYELTINDANGGEVALDKLTDQAAFDLILANTKTQSIKIKSNRAPYHLDIQTNDADDLQTAYQSIKDNASGLSSMNLVFAYQGSSHRGMRIGDPAEMYARQTALGLQKITVEPATHMIVPWGFTAFETTADGRSNLYNLVHAALSNRSGCAHPKKIDEAVQQQILADLDVKVNGQTPTDFSAVVTKDAKITFQELLTVEAFGTEYRVDNLHNCMLGRQMALVSVNKGKNS